MIKITNTAIEKIISALDKENASIMRFGLKEAGCTGFQYFLSVETTQKSDDFEFVLNETKKVVIDAASFVYLSDSLRRHPVPNSNSARITSKLNNNFDGPTI